jgi:phenylacetate-CoA ligase
MHPYLIRNVADPLMDKITGRYTVSAYKELMNTQWLPAEELVKYQEKKLRKLINHAYENVPYYHKLFRNNNLKPDEIKTIGDLKKIPVSDKESLKRDTTYPNNLFAKNISSKKVNFGTTSGTTGSQLLLAKDVNERSYTWAAYWRWLSWMGLERGDKTAVVWGQPISKYKKMINGILAFIDNEIQLDSSNLTKKEMEHFAKRLIKYKPKRIHGYTSSMG